MTNSRRKCWCSIFGFFFCIQFIVIPSQDDSLYWEDYGPAENTETCNVGKSSNLCGFLSFLNQFFALGSELCYLALSMDLHASLNNPFNSYKTNVKRYKAMVFSWSLLSALILIILGDRVYGMTCYDVCWIQTYKDHNFNFYMLFLLYFWVFLIYAYGKLKISSVL